MKIKETIIVQFTHWGVEIMDNKLIFKDGMLVMPEVQIIEKPKRNSELENVKLSREKILENIENLDNWKEMVYGFITDINKEIFTRSDILQYKTVAEKTYPKNNNIESSIGQTLMSLRDLGIIDYVDHNGIYKNNLFEGIE
jgi:hypothetical protein